ncbi:restriction endonuclease [Allosaccharopolyspora coralli]|uniref:Restriction endonuclease n=1 Tax=Allosaccharopolyspora coralli TaxID=2665642 RepID=A0A5Q3Q6Y4_9PSEU|nr:restriction endonuclease [Allosaccharopolyspora coralli]QGK68924.1 restriction endonuclease [Allosaccharopolyspora coralli]
MAVPEFRSMMLPLLSFLGDGEARHWRDQRDSCIREFELTDDDLAETIASGGYRLDGRVQWVHTHLFQAGLVDRPRRGTVQITERGRKVLADPPDQIDATYLSQFEEYREFRSRTRKTPDDANADESTETATPWETVAAAVRENDEALTSELLRRVTTQDPAFLEKLVLRLLTAMGYGGRTGATEHWGRSGDGGIDGTIRQDELGLDRVYVQAKRYTDHSVGRPDIQAFVGALHGVQADRGVFITTSRFTQDATSYVERIANRIILIDGHRLAELMLLYNVGVQDERTFVLKRVDEDFFE